MNARNNIKAKRNRVKRSRMKRLREDIADYKEYGYIPWRVRVTIGPLYEIRRPSPNLK